MEPLTEAELRQFAPRARSDYIEALVSGWSALDRAGINTPLRLSHFLAQCAHETGGFTIVAESMDYSAKRVCEVWPGRFSSPLDPRVLLVAGKPEALAEVVYGGRMGNTSKGDGYRFRGRSFLQTTGRAAYREISGLCGVDLEQDPELLETATIGLKAAIAEWSEGDCNRLADRNYGRAIGNWINRGNAFSPHDPIGYESREKWLTRAWAVFGSGNIDAAHGLALGAQGPRVEALQQRLRDLGYGAGTIDGVFGPTTARAVAAFKLDAKRAGSTVEEDEIVGPLTDVALERGKPVQVSEERATATAADLAAAGSTEIKTGQTQQVAGNLMAAGAAVEGARQAGVLDAAQQQLSWLPTAHTFMVPVIEAVKWGWSNAFWVITLLGGVWMWTKGRHIIKARLAAHRLGFNLFR